jgi:hypothetical protein
MLDFDLVLQKKKEAPFKPELNGKLDIRHFNDEFTNEPPVQSLLNEKSVEIIKKNKDKFNEFY